MITLSPTDQGPTKDRIGNNVNMTEGDGSCSLTTPYLLTSPDTAKLLAVSTQTLAKLVHYREIPYIKIGRRVRFDPTEIAAWLEAKKVRPSHVP